MIINACHKNRTLDDVTFIMVDSWYWLIAIERESIYGWPFWAILSGCLWLSLDEQFKTQNISQPPPVCRQILADLPSCDFRHRSPSMIDCFSTKQLPADLLQTLVAAFSQPRTSAKTSSCWQYYRCHDVIHIVWAFQQYFHSWTIVIEMFNRPL